MINVTEAAILLNLSGSTIRTLDDVLNPFWTEGGHRRYEKDKIVNYKKQNDCFNYLTAKFNSNLVGMSHQSQISKHVYDSSWILWFGIYWFANPIKHVLFGAVKVQDGKYLVKTFTKPFVLKTYKPDVDLGLSSGECKVSVVETPSEVESLFLTVDRNE